MTFILVGNLSRKVPEVLSFFHYLPWLLLVNMGGGRSTLSEEDARSWQFGAR
jgi:hypothetical protein